MKKAKIFTNGQSQAVRLPKEFRFSGHEVSVSHFGEGVLLLPITDPLALFKEALDSFSEDFMNERERPQMQTREDF